MIRARQQLQIVVPATLLLLLILLYLNTKSWIKTGIVVLAVPFSLVGAVWLLYALGYNVSVATWVGMIALAKRIVAPMVGGLASSFVLELLVYPPLYFLWKRRQGSRVGTQMVAPIVR
jgi:Cu/Ag efflux pump CusA